MRNDACFASLNTKNGFLASMVQHFNDPFDPLHGKPILNFRIKSQLETQNMPLAVGTKAPDFTLSTKVPAGTKQIRLSDNFESKNTLLLFFPMAFTKVCTAEMCEVSAGLNAYIGLNAAVYGISGDNPFAQAAWAQKENIIVPLLSDYEHNVAKAYDVMYDSFLPQMDLGMGGVPKRSAFVVDRNGVIQYAESNDDPGKLPNFEKIKEKLCELK
jgi:glutaredoxin-dependent peroxiredoxin